MKKKYTVRQQIAVVIVTIGVVWATLVAQKAMKHDFKNLRDSTIVADGLDESTNKWAFGLLVLSMSVLTASFLGIYQEGLYKRYGGDWKESMFYLARIDNNRPQLDKHIIQLQWAGNTSGWHLQPKWIPISSNCVEQLVLSDIHTGIPNHLYSFCESLGDKNHIFDAESCAYHEKNAQSGYFFCYI
ncbi:UDP-xylose and UDP-N-acetylglucosamine transporter [Zancudomyces culisetae]|uniref:UDP-xylose and UDP-N-acetylglucosamine transporter n=1 Tax=Zancudomyces culisetae TaxID=1213189 RepID=A0A1R1PUN7_ZANCU|nr:UDP-xylose and UDP-N-acetylglucosamine transporter [Zancudomyces culisetae]|eukprot:OMH84657.1 UDP-xylose and UDP-N-acetylglucosamine transporter [Zancudomyces culisetae]